VIPADVATPPNADLIVHTAEGIFEIDKLESWWWKDDWELGLEHRPFSDDFGWVYKK